MPSHRPHDPSAPPPNTLLHSDADDAAHRADVIAHVAEAKTVLQPRNKVYDRTPEGDVAFRARVKRDIREARARGWTVIEVSQVSEPPTPMGVKPNAGPDDWAERIPDYGFGEDGGYTHTTD